MHLSRFDSNPCDFWADLSMTVHKALQKHELEMVKHFKHLPPFLHSVKVAKRQHINTNWEVERNTNISLMTETSGAFLCVCVTDATDRAVSGIYWMEDDCWCWLKSESIEWGWLYHFSSRVRTTKFHLNSYHDVKCFLVFYQCDQDPRGW